MVSRKYTKDYRLENQLDGHGRLVTRPVYCGVRYAFISDAAVLRRLCVIMTLTTALYWIFFWLGLAQSCGALRRWYVSVPFFCGFLPAAFLSGSLYYLWRYSSAPPAEGFTREQKDRIYDRLSPCSLIMLIFAALAGVGEIFYILSGAKDYSGIPDIIIIVSIVIMAAASLTLFISRKYSKMQGIS